ncbi:hypothetical protein [Bradyrhizobium diazoefficiens]
MAGITFQNDSWLADAINGSGIDFSGGTSAKSLLTAEQIKLLRAKREAELQAIDAEKQRLRGVDETTAAYAKTISPYGPTSEFAPQIPSADLQSVEPMSIDIPQTWTDPQGAQDYGNQRDLAIKMFRQGSLLGKSAKDYAEGLPYLRSQSQVATGGVPEDPRQREQIQFGTTGKFTETDESKQPLKNWAVPGSDRRGMTRNGTTDLSGRPLPPGAVVAGQAEISPNVYGDQKAATDALAGIAQKVNNGVPISEDDVQRARILLDTAFPKSLVQQNQGGRNVTVAQRTTPIPDWAGRLSVLVDDYAAGKHLAPAAPSAGAVPYPTVTGMGAPSASAVAAAPPAAAAAAPTGVLPQNMPLEISRGPANPAELRKEITNTQSYSDYASAVPNWNTMVSAAEAPSTNATDLNIVYAVAKLFDPGSVVREGELKLANSTGTLGQQLSAMYSRLFNDKGTLSPETRANLIEQGRVRMQEYANAWDTTRRFYTDKVAPSGGLNAAEVVPPVPEMRPFDRSKVVRKPSARPAAPAAAPAAASDYSDVDKILGLR